MTRSPAPPGLIGGRGALFYPQPHEQAKIMAKVSPGEFVRQVKLESITRVHWPTPRETWVTAVMVIIMTSLLAIFFFGVDAFFSTAVKYLLSFLGSAKA